RLWGDDPALQKVKSLLQKASITGITILLTGESGTGKTFIAREIHNNSKRNKAPFIHVNCAAIPYQLIESELFGYEEGSFTGAKKGGKKGYFELAQHGTIFLDEITELPLTLQGKLLEVIQNKTFYRVGGCEKINIDVRLIAATNRNLKQLVLSKKFREDLYYRINVFPIELPPLRERKDALIEIVNDVLPEICKNIEIEPLTVSGQTLEKMKHYKWPGNIRELENVLAKAAIMCDGKVIMPEDIEFQEEYIECKEVMGSLKEQKEFYERKIILEALEKYNGEKKKTAEYLKIGRTNLFEKIRKYGLDNKVEE
ncbi:MAG: sigma-54 dependent transcriptional regulator, partial [Anaerovorax sp.]|nr:sigma-54 dependent transcriptional regulator [Anaerovorax sp.]